MSTAGALRPDEKDLEVNAPGSAESPHIDISWKNRYRFGVLLSCISITYLAYSSFIRYEISMNAFKVALFIGIALFVLIWIFDSRWLDKIARSKTPVLVRQRWGDILFILVFILVLIYLESNYGRIIAISAFSGFSITAWIKIYTDCILGNKKPENNHHTWVSQANDCNSKFRVREVKIDPTSILEGIHCTCSSTACMERGNVYSERQQCE